MIRSFLSSTLSINITRRVARSTLVNASNRWFSIPSNSQEDKAPKADSPTSQNDSNNVSPSSANYSTPSSSGPTEQDLAFFNRLQSNTQKVKAKSGIEYESTKDDPYGIQSNWFRSLHRQLQLLHTSGPASISHHNPEDLFRQVEFEFEQQYLKYIKDKNYDKSSQRGILLCCLAVATQRVLGAVISDESIIREIIRINLGETAMKIMHTLQKFRFFLLFRLLAQDPFKIAAKTIPMLKDDFSAVVKGDVEVNDNEAVWTIHDCDYSKILANEDCLDLHSEFCCHFSHRWLDLFAPYGVDVSQDKCFKWDDGCCQLRVSKVPQKK